MNRENIDGETYMSTYRSILDKGIFVPHDGKWSGWEDVKVQAGKFRAIKLEIEVGHEAKVSAPAFETMNFFGYSPDVKHFMKCMNETIGFLKTFWAM